MEPLQLNPITGEPFLQLAPPFAHIIVTPVREADALAIILAMNDSRVYTNLAGPPHPFLQEHAAARIEKVKARSNALLAGMATDNAEMVDAKRSLVGGCPVHIIREVKEDGSDIFLGDCSFVRCSWDQVKDVVERKKLCEQTNALPVGHPDLVWSIGGAWSTLSPL